MPRALYYASTVRNLKDVVNYLVLPTFRLGGLLAFKDHNKADIAASLVGTAFYGGITAMFQGQEMDMMDKNVRKAVAAELGKDPEDIKFSDYLDSKNTIVKREMQDLKNATRIRYATDAVFLIPAAMYAASMVFPGFEKVYQAGRINKAKPVIQDGKLQDGLGSALVGAFNLWDFAIFGTKSAYWYYETYNMKKTAHYEIVKVFENIESIGKKFTPNDVIGVINRAREDQGLEKIEEKYERPVLWPILEYLCEKLNNSPDFGVPELVYLVGMNKLNIFAIDENGKEKIKPETGKRYICPDEVKKAYQEIDKIDQVGLAGIAAAKPLGFKPSAATAIGSSQGNRLFEHAHTEDQDLGFAKRLRRNWLDTQFKFTTNLFPSPKKGVEYISPRDFGDVPNYMA